MKEVDSMNQQQGIKNLLAPPFIKGIILTLGLALVAKYISTFPFSQYWASL